MNPWMRDREWCNTLGFLSKRSSLKNERSLNNLSSIFMIFNAQGVKREVLIGKSSKSFDFERFFNWIYVKYLVESTWPLEPTHWLLECLGRLSSMDLSGPALFKIHFINLLSSKQNQSSLIPQHSLICHKLHLFKHTCDFPVGWTTTLNLQWRTSYYLKRLLALNIKMNIIANT